MEDLVYSEILVANCYMCRGGCDFCRHGMCTPEQKERLEKEKKEKLKREVRKNEQ
mgnify:CR=1 FL=1